MITALINIRSNGHHIHTFEENRNVDSYNVGNLDPDSNHTMEDLIGYFHGDSGEGQVGEKMRWCPLVCHVSSCVLEDAFLEGCDFHISAILNTTQEHTPIFHHPFFKSSLSHEYLPMCGPFSIRLRRCFCLPCFEFFMLMSDIALAFLTIMLIFLVHFEPRDGFCNTRRHAH